MQKEESIFEVGLMGGLLFSPEKYDLVSDIVEPSDFSDPLMCFAYKAMGELNSLGAQVDVGTITTILQPQLPDVDCYKVLMGFMSENSIDMDVKYYARGVLLESKKRRFRAACELAILQISAGKELSGIMDMLSTEIEAAYLGCEVEGCVSLQEAWAAFAQERQDELDGKGSLKFKTHIEGVDRVLGDITLGQMITIAATNGGGKTTFGLNILKNIATHDKVPVMLLTLEMTTVEVGVSTLAAHSRIAQDILKRNDDEARCGAIETVSKSLGETKNVVMDVYVSTVDKFAGAVRKIRKHLKIRPDCKVVVVDYIGLMNMGDGIGGKNHNRVNEVSEMTRTLKSLALELNIVIIILAQVNRNNESRANKAYQLTDLRESGSIASDSNVVMFLQGDASAPVTQVIIAKNRNGRTGVVDVIYNRATALFRSAPPQQSSSQWIEKKEEKRYWQD